MKTELQEILALIAPSVEINTSWERDPDASWDDSGVITVPVDHDGTPQVAWRSEVCARVIFDGYAVSGTAYLGGTWERAGDVPWKSNPDISGYERDQTVEALSELQRCLPEPKDRRIMREIGAAGLYLNELIAPAAGSGAPRERLSSPKRVRGTPQERRAWNRAQGRSRLTWNTWARRALNRAAAETETETRINP